MKKHNIQFNLIYIFLFFIISCSENKAKSLFDSAIQIGGTKYESDWKNFKMHGHYSYAFTGGINGVTSDRDGAASFSFYDDELEVYYSGATRIEELEGNVQYEREKYKLSDFELSEYLDESNNFKSKKITAKWDENKSFICYLKKYNAGSEKPSLNPNKEKLIADIYVLRFEVNWGNNAYAFLETTDLDSEKQKFLVELFSEAKDVNSRDKNQQIAETSDLNDQRKVNTIDSPNNKNRILETNNELDAPLIGKWEGTIMQEGKIAKNFLFIVTSASYDLDKDLGMMKGFSMVNSGNKTPFEGTWNMNGDMWPTIELKEPTGKEFNGRFNLSDCSNLNYEKYSFWEAICGKWISYNGKITSSIFLKKISDKVN